MGLDTGLHGCRIVLVEMARGEKNPMGKMPEGSVHFVVAWQGLEAPPLIVPARLGESLLPKAEADQVVRACYQSEDMAGYVGPFLVARVEGLINPGRPSHPVPIGFRLEGRVVGFGDSTAVDVLARLMRRLRNQVGPVYVVDFGGGDPAQVDAAYQALLES